ncbi:MAG: hypothetical protein KC931_14230 [Candidatus Omnitrophica bacterium]|nr:hypothetical protein [Candidatus Omnitrophota bacterium]MCA9448273.1 hypothetical protein [Candidatus Omnitrophota bacterium]MCB9770063.1 hypothetical protein [Candidatus Omnitrophota bacterium]
MLKKIVPILVIVILFLWLRDAGYFDLDSYKQEFTNDNPGGTVHLFMDAALKRDAAQMKKYCIAGQEVACDQLLSEIATVNRTFKEYKASVSGTAGNRTGGTAKLWGEKGDLFMIVTFSVEDKDGVWYISTISSRRVSAS